MSTTVSLLKTDAANSLYSQIEDLRDEASASETAAAASAATASSAATTATSAILATYKGVVAGASLPATAPAAGDWYRISTAGTAHGVDWVTGDIASYKGTSAQWDQISGGIVDANELAYKVNARAPSQALVFDGTAGATVGGIPAFGTGDFTVFGWAIPTSFAAARYIVGGAADAFALYIHTDGKLTAKKQGGSALTAATAAFTANKAVMFAYVRDSVADTGTYYGNGAANGAAASETNDYTVASTLIGSTVNATTTPFLGFLSVCVENRAMSAAEILKAYETGAPDASDYNNASNTSLLTGASSDFSGAGNWSTLSGATISGGKLNISSGGYAGNPSVALVKGRRYKFTVTVDSLSAGTVKYFNGAASTTFATGAGTYTVEFTAVGTNAEFLFYAVGGNAVLDTALFYNLGLVLAPESAAPGNGYQWKDMSGNKADITLPATGVSWALPDRRPNSVRATIAWSGAHGPTSMLAQVALPTNAFVTDVVSTATAGDPGGGMTVGSVTDPDQFVAAVAYSTAKIAHALVTKLPDGVAANDLNLVVDPGTSNYTGSIETEVFYSLAQ